MSERAAQLADLLREGATVLDEPLHRERLAEVMDQAADLLASQDRALEEAQREAAAQGEIARLKADSNALAAWACVSCGARFTQSVSAVALDGVTRCSACVRAEQAEAARERLRGEKQALATWARGEMAALTSRLDRIHSAMHGGEAMSDTTVDWAAALADIEAEITKLQAAADVFRERIGRGMRFKQHQSADAVARTDGASTEGPRAHNSSSAETQG